MKWRSAPLVRNVLYLACSCAAILCTTEPHLYQGRVSTARVGALEATVHGTR